MGQKVNVLYIDDEDNNLNSFKASLRKEFNVNTALNAKQGLEMVREFEYQVVIADQRMPEMTGVEFFEKLIQVNPLPIRILLTGYSDIQSVIDAINKGEVHRFIDKPWNIEQIKNAVRNAGEIYFTRKELAYKNEKLHKVHSEMNQFVYSLSHELRGPLMSISGISKLAKLEVNDPDILEYFNMIDLATHKLDNFIYKMLDFYRSTKIDNKFTKIDVAHLLEQQYAAYQEKWDLSEIDVQMNVVQEQEFYSDDAKLRVIVNNLFSNAYNFQKQHEKDKKISLSITVKNDGCTILCIDNGIGIDEKYQKEVFNLFQRATQQNVGSGIGLYMVKESVEQLSGEIELSSALNEGTKVKVSLPHIV
ncbi:hybrid sensor histidine kinase/response regulator [Anditalea andensis]|uniref:histidine kinase n=1 Tax=Anditalea andensis TaxID=1048983 RepID=A0A074L4D4_9BACT|nr:hybrid sensor histidine kinase/response regulator [Anditalea andensis]KEO74708.1 transcriptional regulator [Anditalea andensis]